MDSETIIRQTRSNILQIALNRPDRLNALNRKLADDLEKAFDEAAGDREVKAIVLSGKGKSFCVGADLNETEFTSFEHIEQFLKRFHALFNKIEGIEKPTIAAIDGYALGGGCELALVCDIRIATERASIGVPEIKMGFLPSAGGTQRLPRLIGISNALEMLFTGAPVDSQTAHRIGLVNKVVGNDKLEEETIKFAETLVNKSPAALKAAKRLVCSGINMDLKSALDFELQCLSHLSFDAIKNANKLGEQKTGRRV